MRTIIKYSILTIIFSFVFFQTAKSQLSDTLVTAWITNIQQASPDEIQFDIDLESKTEVPVFWANATFQIDFGGSLTFSSADIDIVHLPGTGEVVFSPLTGGVIPTDTYYMTPRVFDGRISITIAGPEEVANTEPILSFQTLKLGTFSIKSKSGSSVSDDLRWLTPLYYYQAFGYKLDKELILPPANLLADVDHNLEFTDRNTIYVAEYKVAGREEPEFILDYFTVEYRGLLGLKLDFATLEEAYNKGFIITRSYKYITSEDENLLNYKDTIFRYTTNPDLIGLGTQKPGKVYNSLHDTVDVRELIYCYELLYEHWDGSYKLLDRQCAYVPHALITEAYAAPSPFQGETTITYKVEDHVLMTAKVYDLQGKLVETLFKDKEHVPGYHEVKFNVQPYATQGVYNFILRALPIDDPTIEDSQAIIKAQFVRSGPK